MRKNIKRPAAADEAPKEVGGKKSDITRGKIIAAAKKVFSRLPYHAASMRMIGKEGKFNHELIRYHFPNKAALFETIMREICDDFYYSNISFLEKTERMAPGEGFPMYLDLFIEHHFQNPESLRIIALNMVITDEPESIPGYHYIPEMLANTRRTFQGKSPLAASNEEVERFLAGLNNLLLLLLGAGYCQARILGLNHTGDSYRIWVKTTLVEIFLPHLERLMKAR